MVRVANLALDYLFACAEFGTYGPLRILAGLRAENQAHHWAPPTAASTVWAKQRLKELFVLCQGLADDGPCEKCGSSKPRPCGVVCTFTVRDWGGTAKMKLGRSVWIALSTHCVACESERIPPWDSRLTVSGAIPISQHQFWSVVHATNCELSTEGRRIVQPAPFLSCAGTDICGVCCHRIDVGGAGPGS